MKHIASLAVMMILLASGPVAMGESAGEIWPTSQANPGRTGAQGLDLGPGNGSVVWRFQAGSLEVRGPPAIAGGRVYIGSGDGEIYALDALTGQPVWTRMEEGDFTAGAIVANGTVFLGNRAGRVFALDAESGEPKWSRQLDGGVWTTPTFEHGRVYIGTGEGIFMALSGETGNTLWTFNLSAQGHRSGIGFAVTGSPAASEGGVYFAGLDHYVYRLDAESGSLMWSHRLAEFSEVIRVDLAAAQGRLFAVTSLGNLYALNAADGSAAWRHAGGIGMSEAPAVLGGFVYRAGRNGTFAVDGQTGAEVWRFAGRSGIGVAVTNSSVYVSDIEGGVSALDRKSGSLLWRAQAAGFVDTAPVVGNGVVYVGSRQFYVTAIDAGAGAEAQPSAQPRQVVQPLSATSWAVAILGICSACAIRARRRT